MVTRKLIATGKSLAVGLTVGLLARQATATEELVVYGTPTAVEVAAQHALFRTEIDGYIRSLNEQLRSTLDQDLKGLLAPKLELASAELRARG
jgi:hypothetical protein